MFSFLGEYDKLPFAVEDIAKIHRGMNQVKVSVGEHMSEPSEVYVVTVEEGGEGNLSTYVVFFLEEPGIRILYGHDDNSYDSDRRIQVEAEAIEFVEEMGAIVEDVAWENLGEQDREKWMGQQSLYGSAEIDLKEVEDLAGDAIILEDDDPDLITPEGEELEHGEPSRGVIDETSDKVVFIEEKFDEMLKQAFLKDPAEEEPSEMEEKSGEVSIETTVVDTPLDDDIVVSPDITYEEVQGPAAKEEPEVATAALADEGRPAEEEGSYDESDSEELRRKVLRFLSKM